MSKYSGSKIKIEPVLELYEKHTGYKRTRNAKNSRFRYD